MQHMTSDDTGGTGGPVTLLDLAPVLFAGRAGQIDTAAQVLIPFEATNAVAVVPDDDTGRQTILQLERAGVEGTRISYLRVVDPGTDDNDGAAVQRNDARVMKSLGMGTLRGAIVGAIAGAVLAFAVVSLVATVRAGAWAALGGALLFGALGGLWGGFGRLGASDAWEHAGSGRHGRVMAVGVHAPDEKSYERALPILEPHGLWIFDRQGHTVRQP
jgi:hypothetical protein